MPIFVPSNDWEDLNANVATTKNKKKSFKVFACRYDRRGHFLLMRSQTQQFFLSDI
jgi:hypothetical protein